MLEDACRGTVACLERQMGGTAPANPARISPSLVKKRNRLRMAGRQVLAAHQGKLLRPAVDKISNLHGREVVPVDWLIRKNTGQQSACFASIILARPLREPRCSSKCRSNSAKESRICFSCDPVNQWVMRKDTPGEASILYGKLLTRLTAPTKTVENGHNTGFLRTARPSNDGRGVALWG
jgi:hypothetical protein